LANFVLALDPDPERRRQFIAAATRELAPVRGLQIGSVSSHMFVAAWASKPGAPVSAETTDRGASIVWGVAIPEAETAPLDATELARIAAAPEPTPLPAFDGFHALAVYDSPTQLTIAADPLGLFPLYYWYRDQVLLAGASPELFRYHPLFTPEVDPEALASILLTSHLTGQPPLAQTEVPP